MLEKRHISMGVGGGGVRAKHGKILSLQVTDQA